jgi:hypothetical protein
LLENLKNKKQNLEKKAWRVTVQVILNSFSSYMY